MTAWWDRARRPGQAVVLQNGEPVLLPGGRAALLEVLRARRTGFVPEWRPDGAVDAGEALLRLFGTQLDPVVARVARLGERALVEFLSAGGISLGPPRPAEALLAFAAAPAAPAPVQVPQGFQLTSPAADGGPDEVTWETVRDLSVVPSTVAEIFTQADGVLRPAAPGEPLRPFGADQRPGSALLVGFDGPLAPAPTLSLGVLLAAEASVPAPVGVGGEAPPDRPVPVLAWEALAGGRFQPMEVVVDDAAALTRDGAVVLRCPRDWPLDRPAGAGIGPPRRWLRLRLVQGRHAPLPAHVASLMPNLVRALAVRTVRDEWPTPLGGRRPGAFRLSQVPVLAGSVVMEVEAGEPDTAESDVTPGWRRWQEVGTLVGQPPDARVFTLSPATGEIDFGNNRAGRAPPAGVRTVFARTYRVASGRAGAVEAGAIARPVRSIPFLQGVSNPLPASGGAEAETLAQALRRGPGRIRARERAVTAADMALLAADAPGADVARAFALPGIDPSLPGLSQPGVVGVFVVPTRRSGDRSAAPPLLSSETLRAVAAHLAQGVGPLGARIVAAAPRFHRVRIEAVLELDPAADVGATVAVVLNALDSYLDPIHGGDVGEGWELGAAIRHPRVVRRVLEAAAAVRSVPYLALVVDGLRQDACQNAPLSAYGLPWPAAHEVVTQPTGSAS